MILEEIYVDSFPDNKPHDLLVCMLPFDITSGFVSKDFLFLRMDDECREGTVSLGVDGMVITGFDNEEEVEVTLELE